MLQASSDNFTIVFVNFRTQVIYFLLRRTMTTTILLLEIFTKTYTDVHVSTGITYSSFHSFVNSFTVRPMLLYLYLMFTAAAMGCVWQLVIKENDDDDDDDDDDDCHLLWLPSSSSWQLLAEVVLIKVKPASYYT